MSSEQLGGRNTTLKEIWVGGRRERERNTVIWRTVDLGKRLCWGKMCGIFFFYNK